MSPLFSLSERSLKRLLIALAIYITSLVAANTLGIKLMPFLFGGHLSVGVFMFPVVFLMTDIVGEVYGKKVARFFVFSGIISTLLFIIYNVLSIAAPWAPSTNVDLVASYASIFGVSLRFAIASVIAYAVGEYQDVIAFFFAKKRMEEGKIPNAFWLRSLLSNLWSQAFDTLLFMSIALYGVVPNTVLLSLMLTWWLYKVFMGLLYTPLAYVGIWLLKGKEESAHAGKTD